MKFFFALMCLVSHVVFADPIAEVKPQITLTVLDRESKADYESKLAPFLKTELQGCSDCVVKNISSYDEKGNFHLDLNPVALELAVAGATVILVNFNEKSTSFNKSLVESLKAAQSKGAVVVFAAGQPPRGENSAPLGQTVAGQVPNDLIIGELGEKDRLLGASYFGPEMLTALRPPKDYIGEGVAPAQFAARLAKNFHKKPDWVKYLNDRKASSKKIWLDLYDCFSR